MRTRIDARLDEELAAKVERLRRQTGMTITQVVEAALEAWTESVGKAERRPAQIFEAHRFIGSGRGPRHLARDYKKDLARSVEKKA